MHAAADERFAQHNVTELTIGLATNGSSRSGYSWVPARFRYRPGASVRGRRNDVGLRSPPSLTAVAIRREDACSTAAIWGSSASVTDWITIGVSVVTGSLGGAGFGAWQASRIAGTPAPGEERGRLRSGQRTAGGIKSGGRGWTPRRPVARARDGLRPVS